MSEIVLGVGTSHTPLLTIDTALWADRGKDDLARKEVFLADGRVLTYAELNAEVKDRHRDEATPENFRAQAAGAQQALDHLKQAIAATAPDLLVIIGDDQEELFGKSHMPAVAVYTGENLITYPKNEVVSGLPAWSRQANVGYGMGTVNHYPGDPEFASRLVKSLITDGVDVSVASRVDDPKKAGFGHAYGFILERLCDSPRIATVPVLLNTYYPPNVPTPRRCYEIGRSIARAIRSDSGKRRVAVIASGGLTHFHTDEPFDRRVLEALKSHDEKVLTSLPVAALRSGNSEILNWVMAAGALEKLTVQYSKYIPVRRTPAGTGIGLGFVLWEGDRR
jgi:hypothetical protein